MTDLATDTWIVRLRGDAATRSAALEELRDALQRGLVRALPGRYGGVVGVDDIVQISLLKILEALDSFRGDSRFTTWAMAVAVRVAMSELRRKYYRDVPLGGEAGAIRFEPADVSSPDPENAEARRSLCGLLERLIDERLTERQRLAIRGALEGLPVEVIAERLRSNRNAVYKLLHDARNRLKEGLEANGVTAEDIRTTI